MTGSNIGAALILALWGYGQYVRGGAPLFTLDSWGLKKIMKKVSLILAIACGAVFVAWSQANAGQAKKSQLDGAWELVAGQQLPKGARDIKIISGGHFIFAAYDTEKGELLYTGGGTFTLNGSSYTEHVDFGDRISAGIVAKDQHLR